MRGFTLYLKLAFHLHRHLLGLGADEGVVQCRQRIEVGGLAAEFLRLGAVAFALICLAEAVEVLRVLLARLL